MFAPLISAGPGEGTVVADVALRPIDDSDLDALFDQMRDPERSAMVNKWRSFSRVPCQRS
jgi:hypothetical protein